MKIGNKPRKFTPVTAEPLTKDEDGEPPDGAYKYTSNNIADLI